MTKTAEITQSCDVYLSLCKWLLEF